MVVSLKVFKVFVDETTENCYANYKVNRNFIYLITKSRRKLVRNMAKAVRMADIAQRLGISTVSVSKGLAGKEGVSAEMRAKIVATAEEMGYQPPARTNAHPGGESIGILVADRFFNENAFYSNLYRSVLKAAAEQDISVLMEIVLPQAEKSCNMPTFLVNRKVDGLIFADRRALYAAGLLRRCHCRRLRAQRQHQRQLHDDRAPYLHRAAEHRLCWQRAVHQFHHGPVSGLRKGDAPCRSAHPG